MGNQLGAVAIGRNEGERLKKCLESLVGRVAQVVYVDSGSTDDSVAMARRLGVAVVDLDTSIPFTAARARNAGYAELKKIQPETAFVMFVDGDCEVVDGWLDKGEARLKERPELAVVCGRRRERYPEASIYNKLCDIEWDTPVGDADACGGDAMMRTEAFDQVGGFKDDLIAGEEPELCVRFRQAGWKIERIAAEMTLHDAAMTSAAQWWRRSVRAGHAFAEGAFLHGNSPQRHWVREASRTLAWGGVLPAVAVGAAPLTLGASTLLLAGYPVKFARGFKSFLDRGMAPADAALYSASCTLAAFPEFQGLAKFVVDKVRGTGGVIIEYKGATKAPKE